MHLKWRWINLSKHEKGCLYHLFKSPLYLQCPLKRKKAQRSTLSDHFIYLQRERGNVHCTRYLSVNLKYSCKHSNFPNILKTIKIVLSKYNSSMLFKSITKIWCAPYLIKTRWLSYLINMIDTSDKYDWHIWSNKGAPQPRSPSCHLYRHFSPTNNAV